jgi:hypothetical protein
LKIERRNLGGSAGSSGTTFMAAADFPECGEDTEAHAGRQGRTRDYDKELKALSERSVFRGEQTRNTIQQCKIDSGRPLNLDC